MAESNIRSDRVGQQVGEYRLLRLLGGGGFGEVYLGEHMRSHSYAAIKILHARLTRSEELKAFINEARTFRLKHPHIVPLLDFGMALNDVPYLVMEYASHGTLRERHPLGIQVPLPAVVSYVNQVASALQYAHDLYLIHRDVKPENMLVGANGGILLTDFGIATVAQNSYTLSKQHDLIGGTAAYMAPEQIDGKPHPASDQYALAVLTYEWLSGKRPFQGTAMEVMMQHMTTPPSSLSPQVPMLTPEIERVIFTALAKDPRQRFSNIQAFATALTQASRQPFPLSLSSSPPFHATETMSEAIPSTPSVPFSDKQAAYTTSNVPFVNKQAPQIAPSTPQRHVKEPQPPLRKSPSWGKILLVVLLVLLVSGISTFVYAASGNNNFKTLLGASTSKATPTIAATPTIPDAHTDPSGFYTWITSRQPANVQSFADTTLGWDTSPGCSFVNGNYQVSAQPAQGVVILAPCLAEKTNYVDFVFQVDMTVTRSETAGLIFHSNSVLNAEYLFPVNSDNTYLLNTSTLSFSSQNTIAPQTAFSGQTPNRLTVIAHGHDISLFINGHHLTTVSDATASSGQIGLFVEARPTDKGTVTANFSNLKIWTL